MRANCKRLNRKEKFFSDECPAMCPGVRVDAVGVDAMGCRMQFRPWFDELDTN